MGVQIFKSLKKRRSIIFKYVIIVTVYPLLKMNPDIVYTYSYYNLDQAKEYYDYQSLRSDLKYIRLIDPSGKVLYESDGPYLRVEKQ